METLNLLPGRRSAPCAGSVEKRDEKMKLTNLKPRQAAAPVRAITLTPAGGGFRADVSGWTGGIVVSLKAYQRQETEIAELRAELDQAKAREQTFRHGLWAGHGHTMLYGDDGEMQCGRCAPFGMFDYRRARPEEIVDTIQAVLGAASSQTAVAERAVLNLTATTAIAQFQMKYLSEADQRAIVEAQVRAYEEAMAQAKREIAEQVPPPKLEIDLALA